MDMDLEVVVLGEAEVALVAAGPLSGASTLQRTLRGEAVLTAMVAARAGAQTALVTRVGDDGLGDWLVEAWEDAGLHLDFATRVRGRNALVLDSPDEPSGRAIRYGDGSAAAGLDASDIAAVPWRWTRCVFASGATQALGSGARDAVVRAFEAAREAGARTIYAPALRGGLWPDERVARAAMDDVLGLTDVLVVAAPFETGRLLGEADPVAAARRGRRLGVELVIVLDGLRGAVIATGNDADRVELQPLADAPRDVSPARAAFMGTLLTKLARRVGPHDAVRDSLNALEAALATAPPIAP